MLFNKIWKNPNMPKNISKKKSFMILIVQLNRLVTEGVVSMYLKSKAAKIKYLLNLFKLNKTNNP